jgi:hypothetical protein
MIPLFLYSLLNFVAVYLTLREFPASMRAKVSQQVSYKAGVYVGFYGGLVGIAYLLSYYFM